MIRSVPHHTPALTRGPQESVMRLLTDSGPNSRECPTGCDCQPSQSHHHVHYSAKTKSRDGFSDTIMLSFMVTRSIQPRDFMIEPQRPYPSLAGNSLYPSSTTALRAGTKK